MFFTCCSARTAPAGLALINEIYFDPPSSGDNSHEYIELRGTPGMALDNYYLIILESEGGILSTLDQGSIDLIFDLNGRSFGSNGFLTLRQKAITNATAEYGSYAVAAGTTDIVNSGSGAGWGSTAANSNIGVQVSELNGRTENAAFTAMLIRNDGHPVNNKPVLNDDLDLGNNGLDFANGKLEWQIIDSIGVLGEVGEVEDGARSYSPLTFAKDSIASIPDLVYADHIPPGGVYVGLEYEVEMVSRWGNSAGNAPENWHVTNLTLEQAAGFTASGDFRQSTSGNHPPDPGDVIETNHGVPYGTNLTNSLGAPNYPLTPNSGLTFAAGDFDADGDVDATDLNVEWVKRFGADLDGDDILAWQRNLNIGGQVAVPEPASAVMGCVLLAAFGAIGRRRRPRG